MEGAAQVRAAADAAAEAMASRFAGGRKAAHAAHAIGNGRPVVPPETPSQSREPTPRDGDAAPQITVRASPHGNRGSENGAAGLRSFHACCSAAIPVTDMISLVIQTYVY